MEGLAGNSKPIYEVCDYKSEKSAPMYCFEGTLDCVIDEPGSINLEVTIVIIQLSIEGTIQNLQSCAKKYKKLVCME